MPSACHSSPVNSLAYTGNKFKTDELVPVFLSTETGIYESFVVTEQALTDAIAARDEGVEAGRFPRGRDLGATWIARKSYVGPAL